MSVVLNDKLLIQVKICTSCLEEDCSLHFDTNYDVLCHQQEDGMT